MSAAEVFGVAALAAFGIQWIAFVPAYLFKTEKFYDLTGSLTYLSVTWFAVYQSPGVDLRGLIVAVCVSLWAVRLGFYLFRRVLSVGEDSRFAAVRGNFAKFLLAWTLQGLWVVCTLAAGLFAIVAAPRVEADLYLYSGLGLWLVGFAFEALADLEKARFRSNAANKGKFISSGLWGLSRHPNYFGEIVLWLGIAVIAFPLLTGWQYAALLSPVFVIVLLMKGSGVPLLEEAADKRWGGQVEYEAYKARTPVLVPFTK